MERGDYEEVVRLNGSFDSAMMKLRSHHNQEVQSLRILYIGAVNKINELQEEIQKLKGEKDGKGS